MSTAIEREDPTTEDIERLDAKIKGLRERDRDMLTEEEKALLRRPVPKRESLFPYADPPESQRRDGPASLIPIISTGDNYPGFRLDGKLIHQRVLDGIHSQQEETGVVDQHGNMKTVTKIYRSVNWFVAQRKPIPEGYTGDQFISPFDHTTLNQPGLAFQKYAKIEADNAGVMLPANPTEKLPGESIEAYSLRMQQLAELATRLMVEAEKQKKVIPPSPSEPQKSSPQPQSQTQNLPTGAIASIKEKLQHMSLKSIQEWAADEEVDLKNAKTKEEAMKAFLSDPRFSGK